MKYLKSFIESVKDDPLASLKSCFDGFEEFGATLYSNISQGEKSVGIVWNDNLYKIDYDILDELESSLGKAKEIGFKFFGAYIDIGSNGVRDERMHFKEDEDLTKILGKEVSFISVYFDNRYYQNIEEETITENFKKFENILEGDVTNCFDHIDYLKIVKMASSSKVFNRIRLISKEKEWLNGYTTDQNLIDDIIAGIGMVEELGFQFIKIYFESSTGGKDIEISGLNLLENLKGRLKKIKKFPVSSIIIDFGLNPKNKVLENINSHYPGKYDTELKYCFDGFEDLNLHCHELTDRNKRGVILITKRHEKFTAVPFDIHEDFMDELESSIGKAGELGYTIRGIHLCELDNRENKSLFHDKDIVVSKTSENSFTNFKEFSRYSLNKKSKNISGRTINSIVKAHNVLIYFNKPMVKENISLEPNLKDVFDHISDQGIRVFKTEMNISDSVIKREYPAFKSKYKGPLHSAVVKSKIDIIGISKRTIKDGDSLYPEIKLKLDLDIIDDIESAIGMAKEIGYQLIKINLNFAMKNKSGEVARNIKDLNLYKNIDLNNMVLSFIEIT